MKPKKFNKKLALNKKTIANLNHGQLGNAKGGYQVSPFPCIKTERTCTPTCNTCPSGGLEHACCITFGEHTCEVDCTETCDTCWETNCSSPCC